MCAYKNALKIGKVKVYRGRIMLIGQTRAGKKSLKKSLLGLPFNPEEDSTTGIEVDPSKFEINIDQVSDWKRTREKLGVSQFASDLAKMVEEREEENDEKCNEGEEEGKKNCKTKQNKTDRVGWPRSFTLTRACYYASLANLLSIFSTFLSWPRQM